MNTYDAICMFQSLLSQGVGEEEQVIWEYDAVEEAWFQSLLSQGVGEESSKNPIGRKHH